MEDQRPETPPEAAGTTADTPPPGGDGSSPTAAQPEAEGHAPADAIADAGPETTAEPAIDPSNIVSRETPTAYSQTVPLDMASVEEIADHVAEGFAPEITRFVTAHPGIRHMVTVAVHAGGAILHSHDVEADSTLARQVVTDHGALEQYLRQRFPHEVAGGGGPVDIVKRLLDKAFPRPASEAGLAAAVKGS